MAKQSTPKAQVESYIAALPPGARKALKQVRAAFKNHYSMYPIGAAITRSLAKDVEGYETSKGTIRFPLAEKVPVALVKKLVKARIAESRQRGK